MSQLYLGKPEKRKSIKAKTIKLLGQNIGKYLYNLWIVKDFLKSKGLQ